MPCSVATSISSSGHRGKSPTLVASGRRSGTTPGRPGAGTPGSGPGELAAGTASSNYPAPPGVQAGPRRARDRLRMSQPACRPWDFRCRHFAWMMAHTVTTTGRKDDGRHVNIQEIRELIRMRPPELHAADRRLAHCHDIADLRRAAQRLIPRPVFDYVDGGSDEELSLAGNVEAFRRWRFVPRALANV